MYHINFLRLTSFALFCFEGGIVVLGQEMNLFLFFFFLSQDYVKLPQGFL